MATPFTPGPITSQQARQLNDVLRMTEAFARLTVSPPLSLTRAAGIPCIRFDSTKIGAGDVILGEITGNDGAANPVHTAKQKTRDTADNDIIDYAPATTYLQVLNVPSDREIATGTLVFLVPIPEFEGWWWAIPVDGVLVDMVSNVCLTGTGAALWKCGGVMLSYVDPGANWLIANGAAVSRTTYACLNAIANAAGYAAPWGPGNGTTTFNVPTITTPLQGYLRIADDTPHGLTVEFRQIALSAEPGPRTCEESPTNCCPAEECCPGVEVPDTLYIVFTDATGDCDCLVSATLVYDADLDAWIGTSEDCETTLTLQLECDAGTWVLTDDCGNTWTSDSEDCDPFALVFCTTIGDGCPCTGDVCASITTVPPPMVECCAGVLPVTMTATINHISGPACAGSTTITWDGGRWVGDMAVGAGNLHIEMYCFEIAPGTFIWRIALTDCHTATGSFSPACDPFSGTAAIGLLACCAGSTVSMTIAE